MRLPVVLCALVLAACGSDADVAPNYTSIQENLFNKKCALGGCHDSSSEQGGLNLSAGEAYGQLIDIPSEFDAAVSRVVPGDPDASLLVLKLEGAAGAGPRMPQVGPPVDGATIDAVRQWIADGAPRN